VFDKIDRQDRLFLYFALGLFAILTCFGIGTSIVILFHDKNDALALRMINVFAAMFSSLVGLGTGYLLGTHAIPASEEKDDGSP
jgi:hypothetical protein